MNETYQNRITDQICKIQNDRALIAFYDRLRYAPLGNYAQLHAKGEYQENGHKVHSLICITIQDYSNGTGDRNIITQPGTGTDPVPLNPDHFRFSGI